ncbi:hypothetical protein BC628DRAFT_1423738 [Trametes gibbosa]|nr:hypothetical protein BC628DRAFT_1423738 [Trametes gibbosa]
MALALSTTTTLAPAMPLRSASLHAPNPARRRLLISTALQSPTEHHDAPYDAQSPASPAECDDPPLSPMVFHANDEYEKNRLSVYVPPQAPRAASSPSSPNDTSEESSPILFSHPNLSSPTLVLPPLPVFPSSHALAVRSRRPLPPLPKVVTVDDGCAAQTASRQALPALFWSSGRTSPFGSDIDDRDSDSLTAVSLPPTPSSSSPSTATSVYTTASSEPPDSVKQVDAFPRAAVKPRPHALTISTRSHSSPLPSQHMPASLADRFASPHISVTPASPVPPKQVSFRPTGKKRTRTASATSFVIASDPEDDPIPRPRPHPPARSVSPTPSLTPSMSSTKSASKSTSTLRRIASKTMLFGRRKMSTSSDPWGEDDEDTVVGHGASYSLDDQSMRMRARSESPLGSCDGPQRPADCVPRAMRRVEIAEVTLTPHGDVWQERDLDEVIPKLRQLRAPTRIKI